MAAKKEVVVSPAALYKVQLTTTEPMLGTAPSNPQVYADYIATKKFKNAKKVAKSTEEKAAITAQEEALIKEELAMLPEDSSKGITVFRRNAGGLIIIDCMVRGYLKEAAAALGLAGASWGLTTKIDRWVFVTDEHRNPIREIPIIRDGVQVTQPDSIYERPLRAMTMQGPRISLAASEQVNPTCTLSFHLYVLPMGVSKGGLTPTVIKEWLSYGVYSGVGQYRSGSFGRFEAQVELISG